jgi:hypothetical protein
MVTTRIKFDRPGRHTDVSDDLNNLKDRLAWLTQWSVGDRTTRCFAKRCAHHHPVTLADVLTQPLYDVPVVYPVQSVEKMMYSAVYGKGIDNVAV